MSPAHSEIHRINAGKEVKVELIEAAHLETVSCPLDSHSIDKNEGSSADETHFAVIADKGRTLGLCGATAAEYVHVGSGAKRTIMWASLSDGRDPKREKLFHYLQE